MLRTTTLLFVTFAALMHCAAFADDSGFGAAVVASLPRRMRPPMHITARNPLSLELHIRTADGTGIDQLRGVLNQGRRVEEGAVAVVYQALPASKHPSYHEFVHDGSRIELESSARVAIIAEAHQCVRQSPNHLVHRLLRGSAERDKGDGHAVKLVLEPVEIGTYDLATDADDPHVRICTGKLDEPSAPVAEEVAQEFLLPTRGSLTH